MYLLFSALTLFIAAVIVIVIAKGIASHPFQCKHCSETFRINWPKVLITEHSGKEYHLLCPHCNAKDWCIELPKES